MSVRKGRYRHFKGNEYEVLCTALHSENCEEMIVYKALYGEGGVWVRPACMWNEIIERDGQRFRRFTYIDKLDIAFSKAGAEELDEIFAMYRRVVENMLKNGVKQWGDHYPTREILADDIEKQQLYIGRCDGELMAAYVMNDQCDEEYKDGNWQYPEASFLVVHRLCVSPDYQGCGAGRIVMEYIESSAADQGAECMRLDTFTGNPYALGLYTNMGYKTAGYIYWDNDAYCMLEKKL